MSAPGNGERVSGSSRNPPAEAAALGDFSMPRMMATERLSFGPLGAHHLEAFVRVFGDEASARYIGGLANRRGAWRRLAMFAGQWSLHDFGHYALTDRDGAFVGYAGLWSPDDKPDIEIGYTPMPEARGKGYASEAVTVIRAEAMRRGAPPLVSYVAAPNSASLAVAGRCGAARGETLVLGGEDVVVMRYPHDLPAEVPAMRTGAGGPLLEASAMPLTIRTARLQLGPWRPDHFERFAAFFADPVAARFVGGVRSRYEAWRSFAATAGHWLLSGFGPYAVEADGELVGFVGLIRPETWPDIEIAWSIFPDAQGRGYATEAAKAVREVAAEQGLSRMVSYIHPDHRASERVAERLGAVRGEAIILDGDTAVTFHHVPGDGPSTAAARIAEGLVVAE